MRISIPRILLFSSLFFIIPCAWPGVAKAQEGLRLQLFDWQDQLTVTSRPELDGRLMPHLENSRRGVEWDDVVYGFEMSYGNGWMSGDEKKPEGYITTVPRMAGFLLANPLDPLFLEGESELDWPLAPDRSGNEYLNGKHRWDGLLTWGEEHGFDWLFSYDATHGNNRNRDLKQGELGPAPFLQQHFTTSLRPRVSFGDDIGFGLGADYGYREWVYGGGPTPLSGVSEHEFSGTLWQCIGGGDLFGANRCVTLLRVAYTTGSIGHSADDGEKVCENGKCGFVGPQPDDRPDQIQNYEEFAMKVGFVDGLDFGDIKAVLSLEPSWIWDADRCSFFGSEPMCKDPDDWRRGGWMFNAEIGYTHAIEEWTWGIFFRSKTDPSPDGRMLGTARRFEIAVGHTDSERDGFGFNTELAMDMWEEIFCGSCRTSWLSDNEDEDEDSVPSTDSYDNNSTIWLAAYADLFWDFTPNIRAGITWESSYGNQLNPQTWSINDNLRSWAHEGRMYISWRPAFSELREERRDFGGPGRGKW